MSDTRNLVSVITFTLVVVLSVVTVGAAAPALAHEDVPAAYYGNVTIDGEPAPEGTTVSAVVDGERRGTILVEEPGKYGETVRDGERLEVPGSSDDGEVTFLVNGEAAETEPASVQWESGDLRQVDLSATDVGTANFAVEIDEDESNASVAPNDTATVVADVENTGDGFGERTVEFAVDGDREDAVEGVQLEPGESTRVSFATELEGETTTEATVSTGDDEASVTLSSDSDGGGGGGAPSGPGPGPAPDPTPKPPSFDVIDGELGSDDVRVGQSVAVTATVENTGPPGTETVAVLVDGEVEAERQVRIDEGATEDVTVHLTLETPGTYEIAVGEREVGTLTVSEPAPAELTVRNADLGAFEVGVGESVAVTATVENTGETTGTSTVELLVDGDVVAERDVTVAGGETEPVSFEHAFDAAGRYEVVVSGVSAGTITVVEETEADGGDSIPGFGATTAIAALLVAHLVLRRR
ncbi:CARDB domain-containing protein [Halopiger goleimassiliensis]|uniref:CARDB domain-containing protein n=1 Tax=Halopiger goleimassiliensis TaxID=1293048 RepID=UPI000B2BF8D1|nr:CARDB domain-containing protein [Halopiger goleimassiliensis]